MNLPGEQELRRERTSLLATMESLTDEQFDNATTLCAQWAPRDVLAHLLGIDDHVGDYVRAFGNAAAANATIVARGRGLRRDQLLTRGERWAAQPAPHARAVAPLLLGDLAMHHRDVLRGLGRTTPAPSDAAAGAILREGFVLGPHRALRYRVVPTDGGRPIGLPGRPELRGTREALGLWLAGRTSVADELEFAAA